MGHQDDRLEVLVGALPGEQVSVRVYQFMLEGVVADPSVARQSGDLDDSVAQRGKAYTTGNSLCKKALNLA
jgi:hypothetical protein